jgi:hypothetical protein
VTAESVISFRGGTAGLQLSSCLVEEHSYLGSAGSRQVQIIELLMFNIQIRSKFRIKLIFPSDVSLGKESAGGGTIDSNITFHR